MVVVVVGAAVVVLVVVVVGAAVGALVVAGGGGGGAGLEEGFFEGGLPFPLPLLLPFPFPFPLPFPFARLKLLDTTLYPRLTSSRIRIASEFSTFSVMSVAWAECFKIAARQNTNIKVNFTILTLVPL